MLQVTEGVHIYNPVLVAVMVAVLVSGNLFITSSLIFEVVELAMSVMTRSYSSRTKLSTLDGALAVLLSVLR